MSAVSIPGWTSSGVLPPINPASPVSTDRSPYEIGLTNLILRFNTSPARQAILTGLLDFRRALHEIGLVRGFQWLDGSFLEDVETLERRSPNDIDIVTFYHLPMGQTQKTLGATYKSLFIPSETKRQYQVDAYFVQLDASMPGLLVRGSTYWYSVWSHTRNGLWKGYLQIDLAPVEDAAARVNLATGTPSGGHR